MGNKQDKREVSKDKQPSGTDQEKPQMPGGLPEDVTSHVLDFLDLPDQARYAGVNKAAHKIVEGTVGAVKALFRLDSPESVKELERLEKSGTKINWKMEYKLYLQRNFDFELLKKIHPHFNFDSAQIKLILQLFRLAKTGNLAGIKAILPQIDDQATLLFPDATGMTVVSWINKNKAKAEPAKRESYNKILQELYQRVQEFWQETEVDAITFTEIRDKYELALFEWAVYLGQLAVCIQYAGNRAISLLTDDDGAKSLFLAITSCNTSMVSYLLETLRLQANIDDRLDHVHVPACCNLAAERGLSKVLKRLKTCGWKITSLSYNILEPQGQPENLALRILRSFKNADLGYRGNPLEVAARFGHTTAIRVLLGYPEMLTGSPFGGYRSLVERIVNAALNGLSITQALSSSQLALAVKQQRLSQARMILHAFLNDYKRRRDENTDEYGDRWYSRLGYSRGKKLPAVNKLITVFEDQQTNIKTLATLAKTHPAVEKGELGEIYNAVKEFFKFKQQVEERSNKLSRDEKRQAEREPQPSASDSNGNPRSRAGLFDAKLGAVEAERLRLAGSESMPPSSSSAAPAESEEQPKPEADGGLGKGGGGK